MSYFPTDLPDCRDLPDTKPLVEALRVDQQKIRQAFVLEPRQTPTLINGWTDGALPGTPACYWMDPFGMVVLDGSLATGVSGTVAFVLPARYRPTLGTIALNLRGTTNNFVQIDTLGNVTITTNVANTWLTGLSFRP